MQTMDARQMPMGTQFALQGSDVHVKTREVRLGLVMYGGVSLAIYINGVAHEFFRAVQGQGVYRLLKALIDADIIVDVISGTSAGGVNGILLAYALCNNKDFASTAALWRQHGGIKNLLRSPYADTTSSSFLNSEGYYQPRLQEAFTAMDDYHPVEHDMPSPFNELDLFITGTDVDGRLYTQFDDAGHPIDVKDHRTVFLLKHRQGRKEPFNPTAGDAATTFEALAKLARITSCFPAAFAPVHVAHVQPGHDSADALLQQWGQLGKEAVFLDGGVLDNKPFTYTTKAIFSRVAERDVDRKLFFVEPDPEAFILPKQATNPNAVQAVLAALIGIPSYESIADDLKLLAERNSKLEQYNRLVRDLEQRPVDALAAASPETHELYRRSRLVALSERVVAGLFKSHGQPFQIKTAAQRQKAMNLIQTFDRIITDDDPSATDRLFQDFDVYFCLRRTFRLIYLIHELLYARAQDIQTPDTLQVAETYRHLQAILNRQVKLYEVLQSAVEHLLDEAPFPWETVPEGELWSTIQKALHLLLQAEHFDREEPLSGARVPLLPAAFTLAEPWLPQPTLTAINNKLKERIQLIQDALYTRTLDQALNPQGHSLLRVVARLEQQIIDHFIPSPADPVARAFLGFEALDRLLFPLEMVGSLHEKDIIETIRISPKDAQRGFSDNTLTNKVSGDAVYHFGAFFKRSWRSNDILWGRLDGLCQLAETLLTRERMAQMVGSENGRQKLRQQFFRASPAGQPPEWHEALDPALLFPRAGMPTHEKCRRWLTDLLSDDPDTRRNALDPERFDTMVTLLIEAAQLEVLGEEVPHVITDALDEQHEWNRYQAPAKRQQQRTASDDTSFDQAAPPWVFIPSKLHPDPLVSILASTERTQTAMALLMASDGTAPRPRETLLGRFFRDRYKVGSEMLLRDIPTPVLLEILATALLVVHNVVLGFFSTEAQRRMKQSLLYRLGLSWPLRAFYGLTILTHRSPRAGLAVLIGAIILSAFALSAGIIGWNRIWFPPGMFSLPWFTAFILIPLLILIIAAFILIKISGKLRSQ
jgi:patatin-related protein